MKQSLPFHHPYRHDFARVAVAVPRIRVADPAYNAEQTIAMLAQAAAAGRRRWSRFPELGLSAYTCDDLFHQRALLDACEAALARVAEATARIAGDRRSSACRCASTTGCSTARRWSRGGRVLGVVPKTYLPNYGEFYEARQFSAADTAAVDARCACSAHDVPFGADLIFEAREPAAAASSHVEICEDVWVPIPPSTLRGAGRRHGAGQPVGLEHHDRQGRLPAPARQPAVGALPGGLPVHPRPGVGESTTDLAWDGQALIYENGDLLAESERFVNGSHFITADVDLERVSRERMRQNTFGQSVEPAQGAAASASARVPLRAAGAAREARSRCAARSSASPTCRPTRRRRDERCIEVYNIQVQALVQRLSASGIEKVVIGVSGGLDSTHALLVCAAAMDLLGLPRSQHPRPTRCPASPPARARSTRRGG